MGLKIEFYSASLQEMVDLFVSEWQKDEDQDENDDDFWNALEQYPMADFSFHLVLPDDLDHLCQALREQSVLVPSVFRELLVEQVWVDDPQVPSESLTLLQESFARTFSALTDRALEEVSGQWSATFPDPDTLNVTALSQALFRLREVTQDVVTHNTSLLMHLFGHSHW
jgi:hypothetical protein